MVDLGIKLNWRDYLTLCKPRVVALMLLTALVGMYLASPGNVASAIILATLLGVGCCASGAATINHLIDKHIDAIMQRTNNRPIAQGRISVKHSILFACAISSIGFCILLTFVNVLTAMLTLFAVIGYAGIYTGYLKRATPQNIVIGGLAGAIPPLLGWTAVRNHLDPEALLLVLIIFTWTPPHFWALAIYRLEEYQHAGIPMLPVTHGIAFTKLNIVLYTILLLAVSTLPFIVGMSSWLYLVAAILLGCRFLYWTILLFYNEQAAIAMRTFRVSISYLLLLFLCLLLDHYILCS